MCGMRKKKDKINKENKRRSRREGERSRFSFHDARLATKLCIISGVVLFICMMATDMVSMSRVKAAMRTAQDELFYQYSDESVLKLQSVFDECEAIVGSVTNEMTYLYGAQAAGRDNGGKTEVSTVTGEPLTAMEKEAEIVILNTIWSAMRTNENLEGVGVLFAANKFAGFENYGPYGVKADMDNGRIENFVHSRYDTRPYFTDAQDGTMAFMDAYVDANGTLLYSAAYPIMYNRQFYGVVLMDITADIFVSLDETIAAYPSMYVDLVRNQSGILYSTRADTISQSLSEMMSANAYDLLKAGMTNGDQFQSSQFCIETKESDGKYVRYASPHPGGQ